MIEILGFAGLTLAVFVPILLKFEHRLTGVESKVDALLKHNGLNPSDYMKKSKRSKNEKGN